MSMWGRQKLNATWALKDREQGTGVYFQIRTLVLLGGQPKRFVIIKGIGDLRQSSSGTGRSN